jgi:hypothetical protein
MLLSEICGLVSGGRPLWREDGSAICSVITQWSESLRTRNHTLLSHLRLPQPGDPGSRIYISPGTGWPGYTPGHWVPFTSSLTSRLLRLAGLRWRYSNPPPTWRDRSQYIYPSGIGCSSPKWSQCQVKSQSHVTTYGQSISMPWCLVHSALKGLHLKIFNSISGGVHWGEIFPVTIGRVAWEVYSATWNLGTNSAFALGPRKTTENLHRDGRSQDLPDANWLLASSPTFNTGALKLVPQ